MQRNFIFLQIYLVFEGFLPSNVGEASAAVAAGWISLDLTGGASGFLSPKRFSNMTTNCWKVGRSSARVSQHFFIT